MAYLVIPIQVDALVLKNGSSVLGQDINFRNLPYYNQAKGQFVNQDKPFLSESIIRQPFKNDSVFLDKGVHLHWTLPELITTGKRVGNETIFPAVPNRWLVKVTVANTETANWIIESDYVWAADDATCPVHELSTVPLMNVSAINEGLNAGQQPYAYLGRKYTLDEWLDRDYKKDRYWPHYNKGKGLTSVGWGSLAFDTYYPHCRNVFGMHDNLTDVAAQKQVTYQVIGWYSEEGDMAQNDCIKEVVNELKLQLDKAEQNKASAGDIEQLISNALRGKVYAEGSTAYLNSKKNIDSIIGSICFGYHVISTGKLPETAETKGINLAIAGTPAEAVSSIIIDHKNKKGNETLTDAKRLLEEERLEAILDAEELGSYKLDFASRLRMQRHQKGYMAHDGLWTWRIELTDDADRDNATEEEKKLPPGARLNAEVKALEDRLRKLQYEYDIDKHNYTSMLDALYIDWSRYMMAMYPPEGHTHDYLDADTIRFHIEQRILPPIEKLKNKLGIYPDIDADNVTGGKISPTGNGLRIAQLITKIKEKLASVNDILSEHKTGKRYVLRRNAGTRYWEALPPSLVLFANTTDKNKINNDLLKYSPRLIDPFKQGINALISANGISLSCSRSRFSVNTLFTALDNILKIDDTFGKGNSPTNNWHTFKVEWKIEFFPAANGNELLNNERIYDTEYISKNYFLPEDEADFSVNPEVKSLGLMSNGSVYSGASYVSGTIKKAINARLQAFRDNNSPGKTIAAAYQRHLADHEFLAVTLNGFNDALMQQRSVFRLTPSDPFGFSEHKEFAQKVAAFLGHGEGNSPDPLTTFNPLRCGALKVLSVRLVDTFGRICDVEPESVVMPASYVVPDKPGWANLPPRINQKAAVSLRWIESETKIKGRKQQSRDESAQEVVCGWVLPVYMNQRLEFFDAYGGHLGAITHKGEWENSPFNFETANAKDLSFIPNDLLRKLISWLCRPANGNFHSSFIKLLQDTGNSVMPESRTNPSLPEIIGGTPVAIAKVAVNLFLKGKPSFDVDWNLYKREIENNSSRNSKGFTNIKFPLILGDYHQYNDGLIAYWELIKDNITGKVNFNTPAKALLTLPNDDDSKLPEGFEDETDFRYNDAGNLSLAKLLKEISATEKAAKTASRTINKHEFTRLYIKNGSKYWDSLVKAGWLTEHNYAHPDISPWFQTSAQSCSIGDKEKTFLVLMHPKATINLSTGILPVKQLALPEASYKRALRKMELTFLVSPLITPVNNISASLYQDSRFEWSWLKATKGKPEKASETNMPVFYRTLQKRHIKRDVFCNAWDKHYQQENVDEKVKISSDIAWEKMHQFKILEQTEIFRKEGFALFKQDVWNTIQEQYAKASGSTPFDEAKNAVLEEKAIFIDTLKPVLLKLLSGIDPFDAKAHATGQQCIQEGWLSIKSTTT